MTKLLTRAYQILVLFFSMIVLTYFASLKYVGNPIILWTYSLVFFAFLWLRLSRPSQFFDLFLAIFLTLGLWLKIIYHIIIENFSMGDATGRFQFTGPEFDQAFTLIIFGIIGFAISREIVQLLTTHLKWRPVKKIEKYDIRISQLYFRHKNKILIGFCLLALAVAAFNIHFQIYQRGVVSQSSSEVLKSFIALFLLIGLTAISTIFLDIDYKNGTSLMRSASASFFESFTSTVSLLSRGFVLNAGSILLVIIQIARSTKRISWLQLITIIVLFVGLMLASVRLVTISRSYGFKFQVTTGSGPVDTFSNSTLNLLIDRWVGIEGVMSGVSYHGDRHEMFKRIWEEKQAPGTSIYDKEVATSYWGTHATDDVQFVTIPGFFGWLSILNNPWAMLGAALLMGLVCGLIEFLISISLNNIFFSALIGQILAYRVSHFGYLPQQTYKLFFGIILIWAMMLLVKVILGRKLQS